MAPLLAQRTRTDRAFEKLYQRHVGDVYRYALVVMRNPDDAEDVTQTTFMNAYRAFTRGERPRTPQNWLITIAHNVCRQRFRQSMRRPNELPLEEELAEAQVPEDRGPTADDIRRALGHLAFNQRAALVMRELEGRSYQEIAHILGLCAGAAAGTGVATGVAAKVALVGATAAVATGVGYEGVKRAGWHPLTRSHPARVAQAGSPTASPSTDRAKPVGRSAPETNAAV